MTTDRSTAGSEPVTVAQPVVDRPLPEHGLGLSRLGIRARMANAAGWHSLGTLFNQGSTFAVNIALAHMLGQLGFGRYAMIQTTLAVVAAVAQVATGYTATKYLAEYRETDRERAGRILALCAAVSVVTGAGAAVALLLGAGRLAASLNEPTLTAGLMIAAAVVALVVINGFLMGALAGFESYPALGKAGVATGTIYMLTGAAGGYFGGLEGAVAAAAVSAALQCAVLGWLVVRDIRRWNVPVRLADSLRETVVLKRFSIPAALSGGVSLPAVWFATALVARQDGGYAQLALFSAANSFRLILLFLPNILNSIGMSFLNNRLGVGDEARFRKVFWANLLSSGVLVLTGAGVTLLLGKRLLAVFGPEFTSGYSILAVLMVAAVAEALTLSAFQILQARERIWLSLFGVVLPCYGLLLAVTGAYVSSIGALALAFGYASGWSLALGAVVIIVRRLGIWSAPCPPFPARA